MVRRDGEAASDLGASSSSGDRPAICREKRIRSGGGMAWRGARNIFLRIGDGMPIFVYMPSLKPFAVVVLLVVTAGCWSGKHGMYGNSASFGNDSHLYSHYVYEGSDEPVPVCHVLFVPQWDPPRVDHGFQHGFGGDDRKHTFRVSYAEQGVRQFEARRLRSFAGTCSRTCSKAAAAGSTWMTGTSSSSRSIATDRYTCRRSRASTGSGSPP